MLFRIHLLLLTFLLNSISAQGDFGPIKVDLEGYVDDRKGEIYVDKDAVKLPVKTDPKTVVKTDPKKDPKTGRNKRGNEKVTKDTVKTTDSTKSKPYKSSPYSYQSKKKSSMMLYLGAGGAVLVLIIVAVVVMKKKKSGSVSTGRQTSDAIGLADKIAANDVFEANNKGQSAAAQLPQSVSVPPPPTLSSVVAAPQVSSIPESTTVYDMSEKMTVDTKVDESGRNPSGIIIDEDKYFGSGTDFVDEDMV